MKNNKGKARGSGTVSNARRERYQLACAARDHWLQQANTQQELQEAYEIKSEWQRRWPLAKGKGESGTLKKGSLNAKNLEKLGNMSLHEKVQAVAQDAETEEQAAAMLQEAMSKKEKSLAWGKHPEAPPKRKRSLGKGFQSREGAGCSPFP
eukprot:s1454_g22.t1